MRRYITEYITKDLESKLVFITGPRQCGKTTLSKSLMSPYTYLNYDNSEDRQIILRKTWKQNSPLLIFDELHKLNKWKQWLKGIYDTQDPFQPIVVTGSARLNTYRKAGDSLAGRFFQFRLHPLDMREIVLHTDSTQSRAQLFEQLWNCSPFPEPFLKGDPTYYRRWRTSHLDVILRQDVQDLSAIRDIQQLETLLILLRERIGSNISVRSLAQDLQKDPNTIRKWLEILEELYVIFKVTPYHRNIARALLKEPKYYFFDFCQVTDDGAKFENMVACALLKHIHFIEDTQGYHMNLHYTRTRDGKELDFVITKETQPIALIEVKLSDDIPSSSFKTLSPFFKKTTPAIKCIQVVKNLTHRQDWPSDITVIPAIEFLTSDLTELLK